MVTVQRCVLGVTHHHPLPTWSHQNRLTVAAACVGMLYELALLSNMPPSAYVNPGTSSEEEPLRAFGLPLLVFKSAVGPEAGRSLAALVILTVLTSNAVLMTAASRLVFAMARDGALPLSSWLHRLNVRTHTPHGATAFVLLVVLLIELFELWSGQALKAVVAPFGLYVQVGRYLGASMPLADPASSRTLQLAYAVPLILRLTYARKTFRRGPFHLGRFSEPVACVSIAWLLATATIPLWPATGPVTFANANWSPVVFVCIGKSSPPPS